MRDDHKYRRGETVSTRWGISPKCKGGRKNHRWSKTDSAVCTACGYDVLHKAYYTDFIEPEPERRYNVRLTPSEVDIIYLALIRFNYEKQADKIKAEEIANKLGLSLAIWAGGKDDK